MVTLGEGRDIRTVNSQIPVVTYKSVYNCIMGRPFIGRLHAMASQVHLKLKYQYVCDKLVTINIDLSREKRIYRALQYDQKEDRGKSMEINVAYIAL